jgi:hypothetical protein
MYIHSLLPTSTLPIQVQGVKQNMRPVRCP